MTSFTEALGAFLSDVGASLQEFVDTVSTKDEAATTQAATVPTQARQQAPAANRTPFGGVTGRRNMTRVRLDLDVAHDGSALELQREFQDYARTHGRSENAATLVQFLQARQGVTPRSWSAPDYAGVGSRS